MAGVGTFGLLRPKPAPVAGAASPRTRDQATRTA